MLSIANEEGFPSLYITLQMPSFVKWTLKGSSRKREISTSPGASQYMRHIQQLCTEATAEELGCRVKQKPNPSVNPRHCLLQSNGHREVGGCASSTAEVLTKEHSLPALRP